jgi:hypothetical protein
MQAIRKNGRVDTARAVEAKGMGMRNMLRIAAVAAALGLALGSVYARADGDGGDNGMSPYYGDSWAALEAHSDTMPTPAMRALQDRVDAQAAWAQARDHMRADVQRWRDRVGRTLHRTEGMQPQG